MNRYSLFAGEYALSLDMPMGQALRIIGIPDSNDIVVPVVSALFENYDKNSGLYSTQVPSTTFDGLNHFSIHDDPLVLAVLKTTLIGITLPLPPQSDTTAPSVPAGLAAIAVSSSQINLSWTANTESDLAGYKIYKGGTYLKTVSATSTSDTGLTPSTLYCYTVLAYDTSNNQSAQSSQQCATTLAAPTAPSAPTGVNAVAGDGQVTISWSPVAGADSYNLYWNTTSPATKTTGNKIQGVTSPYVHTGRTNGTTYYYVVTAVNVNGESVESAQVSATLTSSSTASAIAAGELHTCALLANNQVRCWGYNYYGQLGNGLVSDSPLLVTVNDVTTATAIVAGTYHTCALLSGGTIKCWGRNDFGQLGNESTTNASTPQQVFGIP